MKYSPLQLREMAIEALQARDTGDERWFELVVCISMRTHQPLHDIEAAIERLAQP